MNAHDLVKTLQLRKYDKDGDGKLTGEELAEANRNLGRDLQQQLSQTLGGNVQVTTHVIEDTAEDDRQSEKADSDK